MKEAIKFLKECGTFYLATTENDQPRVRPFGAVMEYEEKLYICTNNTKNVFKQIKDNPKVEMSGTIGDRWIRVTGKLVVDSRIEAKAKFLEECTLSMYKADDGIFEVLYFENPVVIIYSFNSDPVTLI